MNHIIIPSLWSLHLEVVELLYRRTEILYSTEYGILPVRGKKVFNICGAFGCQGCRVLTPRL